MVTRREIQDSAHLNPDYIAVKAKSILSHCGRKYAIPLRKDCKNLCPHCYQEVLVE